MRTAASVLLAILFIPLFLLLVASSTVKFELLNPHFWANTFDKNNVYDGLTVALQKSIAEKVSQEGGNINEVKPITSLVTDSNVKDFIGKNLTNLLDFTNGKAAELLVYIPISRAPKGFLPKTFDNLPEDMTLNSLLTKFNVTGFNQTQLNYIPVFGRVVNYILIIDTLLVLLILVGMYALANAGRRLVAISIPLILNGVILVLVYFGATISLRGMTSDLLSGKTSAEVLLGTVMPSVAQAVLKLWLIIGVTVFILGIVFIFIKKGGGRVRRVSKRGLQG